MSFEADSAGTVGLRYTSSLSVDDLIAVRDAAGNHYYVIQDQLRSVRGLVQRSDGAWQVSWRYGPWGRGVDSSGTAPIALRYRWTGREYDAELGWYFFRSRYYDLGARRFVQEDAIGYAGGPSLYGYGKGNPLNGRDPDGLRKNWEAYLGNSTEVSHDAFTCWESHCGGGGGWRRGEVWEEFGFDLLTLVEKNARYEAYQTEKEQAAQDLANRRRAAIIYNETAGLRGNGAELFYARAAIAEVILNRVAKNLPVGEGVGTAVDRLSPGAQRAIDAGNPQAAGAYIQSEFAARLAPRPGDITNGALFFHIYTSLWASRHANEANLIRYGPFTNVQAPGIWYIWIW